MMLVGISFTKWLEYFGVKFGRVTAAVNPAYTSGECSSCGAIVKKSLSVRTHACEMRDLSRTEIGMPLLIS
jgi:transposase